MGILKRFGMFLWFVAASALVLGVASCEDLNKKNITIELSIVTDYALFQKWLAFYNNNMGGAIRGIHFMYSNVFKTVRDRFWNVEMEGVRFDLRFANTRVAYKKDMAAFIEYNSLVKVGETSVNEVETVVSFGAFVSEPCNEFNSSDFNVLVTGYKLPEGLDSYSAGSLVEDKGSVSMVMGEMGLHRTADTLTRKLSEALGGFSDVLDPETNAKEFLMTFDRKVNSYEHIDNLDKFSPATQEAFQDLHRSKTYKWNQENPVGNKWDVDWCTRTHPIGLTYPVERQCQFMYGSFSRTCNDHSRPDLDVCIRLGCTDPSKGDQCTYAGDQRAYDRTSCGQGKWCLGGRCVLDSMAPPHNTFDYTDDS